MSRFIAQIIALFALVNIAHCRIQSIDPHVQSYSNSVRADISSIIANAGIPIDSANVPSAELDPKFWHKLAKAEVKERFEKKLNKNPAKNIIFFLGDGMSITTVTAARILKGQRQGNPGEESQLSFEKFPHVALSKTYCTNAQVADSACTSTAYLTGVKTNILSLGVPANVPFNDCAASMDPANNLQSIYDWAQAAGKSTGFITTTSLTHASPSGGYAHVANRFWECDTDVKTFVEGADTETCVDMATQLITEKPGRNLDLTMGGGMGKFLPKTMNDSFGNPGERSDGKNLLSQWLKKNPQGAIVNNRQQLQSLNIEKTSKIMGIFQSKLMNFHLEAPEDEPTLSEMTETAIKFLSKNENGYFIFIEGGMIDTANHYNKPGLSLDETLELDKAVEMAYNLTNSKDTLIVVTADHAHPLSISGFPERGNDILGLNRKGVDRNGVHYATLNYALGPEQYLDEHGNRIELEGKFGGRPDFVFPSYIKANQGVHGGEDVGVYASGPYAHLFSGVLQQHTLPHLMAYAGCFGHGAKSCD